VDASNVSILIFVARAAGRQKAPTLATGGEHAVARDDERYRIFAIA